jgi:predicted protein tyrosine phosphatase
MSSGGLIFFDNRMRPSEQIGSLYFESFERHSKDFMLYASQKGIVIPSYEEKSDCYFSPSGEEMSPYNQPNSWETMFSTLEIFYDLAQVHEFCKERFVQAATFTEDAPWEVFLDIMASAQQIATFSGRIFIGSQASAERFATPSTTNVVSLLSKSSNPVVNQNGEFNNVFRVPLDDSVTTTDLSINSDQFCAFISAIKYCVSEISMNDENDILIHCSQGQSRSGLFATCLLFILCAMGKFSPEPGMDHIQAKTNPRKVIASCYKHINTFRPVIDINARFFLFLDWFAMTFSYNPNTIFAINE